ncbi:hypothetical protein DFH28DRAFT_1118369 [Melampsora americana]|nr:hypothetical protein DFH28DRAFT_1118369 [Melampsora americana]
MNSSSSIPTPSNHYSTLRPPPSDFEAPNKAEMKKKLQEFAKANGYRITIRSTNKDTKIRYACHRTGTKPSNTSCSQKTDCPFSFNAYKVISPKVPSTLQALVKSSLPPAGTWKIQIKHLFHNHGPMGTKTTSAKVDSLTVIKQRGSLISNRLSQLAPDDRTRALAEIQHVLEKYPTASVQPIHAIKLPSTSREVTMGPTPPMTLAPIDVPSARHTVPLVAKPKPKRKKVKLPAQRSPPPIICQTSPPPVPPTSQQLPCDQINGPLAPQDNNILSHILYQPRSPPNVLSYPMKKPRLDGDSDPSNYQRLVDYKSETMSSRPPSVIPESPDSPALLSRLPETADAQFKMASPLRCIPSPEVAQPEPEPASEPLPSCEPLSIDFVDHEADESFDLDTLIPPLPPTSPMQKDDKATAPADTDGPTSYPTAESNVSPNPIESDSVAAPRRSLRSRHNKDPRVPHWLHKYVKLVTDPAADGHCGYRAIAISLGRSEGNWLSVREALIGELRSKPEFYNSHFLTRGRGDGDINDHIKAIETKRQDVLDTPALWLNSAQMMYIIATTFQRIFCVYGEDQSFTALPLEGPVNDNPPIFLCYDKKSLHFLSLLLCYPPTVVPIPEPWSEWHNVALPAAKPWYDKLTPSFDMYKNCILPLLAEQYPGLYGSPVQIDLVLESDE